MNTSAFGDVTKSISQLCNQVSLINIKVPKFAACSDVFEFINLFETATVTFGDEQKRLLLNKAFPPGKHRSWFESDLEPILMAETDWSEVKKVLIARFSDAGDRDRHFERLLAMKFNPSGDQGLLEFVEDMSLSLKKAFPRDPKHQEDPLKSESDVRYIKAALPQEVKAKLSTYPTYLDAKDVEAIKKAARLYDISYGTTIRGQSDRAVTNELATVLKDLIKSIKNEGEQTRKAIGSAFSPGTSQVRPPSPVYRPPSPNYRPQSPNRRNNWPNNNGYDRNRSPNRSDYQQGLRRNEQSMATHQRPNSPRNYAPVNNNNYPRFEPGSGQNNPPLQAPVVKPENKVNNENVAFNSEMYFQRFGKPPSPCNACGYWHYHRHCLIHLN